MRDLRWNKTDVIECLGVLPDFDEEDVVFKFRVNKGVLTLELHIVEYRSLVDVYLFQEGSDVPVFDTSFFVNGEVRHLNGKEISWLEFSDCLFSDVDIMNSVTPNSFVCFQVQMLPKFRLRFL